MFRTGRAKLAAKQMDFLNLPLSTNSFFGLDEPSQCGSFPRPKLFYPTQRQMRGERPVFGLFTKLGRCGLDYLLQGGKLAFLDPALPPR